MVILSKAGDSKTKATIMYLTLNKIDYDLQYIELEDQENVLKKYNAAEFPICIPPDNDFWFGYDVEKLANLK